MKNDAINLKDKLTKFSEHWSPRVVAEMNDYQFKLVKLQGEFVWHKHEDTDEVFLIVQGEMEIGFRDRDVLLRTGDMFVGPKGVEHITLATSECHAMISEPLCVINTGEAESNLTAENDIWV